MHEFTRTSPPLPGTLAFRVAFGVTAVALAAAFAASIASTVGCGGTGQHDAPPRIDGGAAEGDGDLARARRLALDSDALPPRAEVLALAETVEAQAVREGGGARAVTLHTTAARLVERIWRVEGHERDASEALAMYRAAARDPAAPGACEAALAGARLAGDAAHDASVSYAEYYRVQRRFASVRGPSTQLPGPVGSSDPLALGRTCIGDAEHALARLDAFRPAQHVLDAIASSVAVEGSLMEAPTPARAPGDAGTSPSTPPEVTRIESWPGRDTARIVVVLDRPASYRIDDEVLPGGATARTFLDLDGVDLGDAPADTPERGIVTRIHAGATTTGARISLDLDGRAWRRAFVMRDPYRIVIDVAHHPPGTRGRSPRAVTRLVLDPGHGGKDTGAVGSGGLREKDVTLDIARRVAPILSAKGIDVVLTRDDDRFVSLEERTARANASGADLFVSIHCNASETRTHRGVETYVLDTSRDEIAARVAARENATTQVATAELASILGDLRLADQSQRSTRFAELVERAATSAIGARYGEALDGGVHTAGFYVLVGADMPGVLLETNYISNATEEGRFASDEYRQLFADAIANAVKAYREGR